MSEEILIKSLIIKKILEKYKTIWAIGHLSSLGGWDMQTYMPKEGFEARSEAFAAISVLSQKIFLDKEFVDLIESASKEVGLNDHERGILRLLNRQLKFYRNVPADFLEEFSKATTEGYAIWEKAKKNSDFQLFAPILDKIVRLARKKAEYLGYEEHPYNALLDEYEEGMTVSDVEKYFDYIRPRLIELLKYIQRSDKYNTEHAIENESYDVKLMKKLNDDLLEFIHYNNTHLRIDVSPHPFTSTIGKGDTRITTRYEGKSFGNSYGSTMHEYGHALYELQSHENLHYTPISGGSSLVIHESQSRFWENFVGRSKAFLSIFYESISKLSPAMENYSIDDIYQYLNNVKPSLKRVEADELTYHFHIMIRFEIEKMLFEDKIEANDVPRIWNEKYESYLGVKPENDAQGALQDVHWSGGSFGYFPTYSLGTALSAMWKHCIEKDIGKIDELIINKEGIRKIQNWLKEKIHQYGSTYTFKELVMKMTGEEFTPAYLINYLEHKYKNIY